MSPDFISGHGKVKHYKVIYCFMQKPGFYPETNMLDESYREGVEASAGIADARRPKISGRGQLAPFPPTIESLVERCKPPPPSLKFGATRVLKITTEMPHNVQVTPGTRW